MLGLFRNPYPRAAEPRRLLALASFRRRIIEDVLELSGQDADLAAFDPASAFQTRLTTHTDLLARHRLLLGLISVGRREVFAEFLGTHPMPVPPGTIDALRLVLPLPAACDGATIPCP